MSLRILLVGSGGREHALAWKLAQSPKVSKIYVVPGNGGTTTVGKVENVSDIKQDDFAALLKFSIAQDVRLLVPGPEAPLVEGIVDYFEELGPSRIKCFGPSKAAARLEGSKVFAKKFMKQYKIPTAAYETYTDFEKAKSYLKANPNLKVVIKADGLAAGKGVLLPENYEEAVAGLSSVMVDHEFGAAGNSVVIEEFLEGQELSILSFSDGRHILSLPAAQDHKRIFDNDQGPNTGGMGCYAPTPIATPELIARIHKECLQPTIDGMRQDQTPFVGCLFSGYMITNDGPKMLEYNVRFGDPETQTLLPLLDSDLADLMISCTRGYLDSMKLKIKSAFSTTVVVAAGGYPGSYDKGTQISLQNVADDTFIFHAGTSISSPTSNLLTSGGRVIASTAIGSNITQAVERAYHGVSCIKFDGMQYRKDIAHRALKQNSISALHSDTPMTYASAGVSITSGNDLVSLIKPHVRSTARPGATAMIGGFGGDISLADAGYGADAPRLVCAIDGIGTKLMLARDLNRLNTVGIDLVAMNVNDLVVAGAEPLAFLDYYACGHLDVHAGVAFVEGVARGCRTAGCALVGGETAEMPGLYTGKDFDAAGCAIGALRTEDKLLPATDAMRVGDVLLGLASSGPHSNGYSLIRKIIERAGLSFTDAAPWTSDSSVGEALLEPTRIYVKSLMAVLRSGEPLRIKGLAHITGGGLTENIPRMLPSHLAAHVHVGAWQVPEVFRWLKKAGGISNEEFPRVFNTGIGMVAVVAEERMKQVKEELEAQGENVFLIGVLREKREESCVIEGTW